MRGNGQILIQTIKRLGAEFGNEDHAFRALLLKYCSARWSIDAYRKSPFFAMLPDTILCAASEIEELPKEIELEHFALAYEGLFSREHSKKKGLFYTPAHIAEHIVRKTLEGWTGRGKISILDPACGAGIFLMCVLDFATTLNPDALSWIIPQGVFGIDIDSQAVELCRLLLALKMRLLSDNAQISSTLVRNVQCGNSLISPEQAGMQFTDRDFNAFSYHSAFPEVFEKGGFDYIVGNPPYGLSRGDQLSPRENAALKKIYSDVLSGKPDKYMLFMARSYELLRKGGVCSFIVPNSWLGIRSGRALRQKLLSEGALTEIEVLEFAAFEDVSVEAVIFRCRKPTDCSETRVVKVHHVDDPPAFAVRRSVEVPLDVCRGMPGFTIPVNWDTDTANLVTAVRERCLPLGELNEKFTPLIALQAYATGKGDPPQTESDVRDHVFHREKRESEDCLPYLEGADVKRYSVSWSGKYLRFGPWLAENHPVSRFSGPRILIREILASMPYVLTCAFMDEPAVYNRSILHVIPGPGGTVEGMLSLLAILNSRLASNIIRVFGQKSQRKLFPKVVNDDLKNFPLPRNWCDATSSLAPLALEKTRNPNRNDLDKEIDRRVEDLYGITGTW